MAASYDWEAIEAEYRAGQISVRKIAAKHGCSESSIRSKAKSKGWQRDLADKVQAGIKAAITKKSAYKAKPDIPQSPPQTDEEIIESAVQTGVAIIESHQGQIALYQQVVSKLGKLLKTQVASGKQEVMTKSGDKVTIDLDLEYVGKTLNAATNSLERLIKLERQAHNLNEGTDSDYEKALKELADGL